MPTTRTYRSRTTQAALSEAARRFLMGQGDDLEHDFEGLSLEGWNELDWLAFRGPDDEAYVWNGAAGKVSGLSAKELVQRFGAEFLKAYQREHGPGEFPAWHYRFNGGDDAGGE
jgi:hypothetical protein